MPSALARNWPTGDPLSNSPKSFSSAKARLFSRGSTLTRAPQHNPCRVLDFSDQLVPYEQAWQWQRKHVQHMISQQDHLDSGAEPSNQGVLDTLLLLQHPPVFTLGSGSTLENLRFDPAQAPAPLFRTERGGEVTAHSPGQLVAYPILNLRHHQQDLHWYMRSLEEVIMRCLEEVAGIQGVRVPGMTGVWVGDKKIAAIGVRVSRWITYHGLALNVTNDLSFFDHIVPCGLEGRGIWSAECTSTNRGDSLAASVSSLSDVSARDH
ncbi:hypothetical protein WJX84_009878 [Apatococcus fuscideae]|uniref:lipoyl(octanoyl) transferase n=1 Tax=Apatococcus fuscideae TaxID=2026836 RepID=A0AAW1T145_9CHLO